MSLVRQCDRCGKTFRPYIKMAGCKSDSNYTRVHVMSAQYLENNYDGNKSKYWDLCPECAEKLNQFLENTNTDVVGKEMNSGGVAKASTGLENIPVPDEGDD